MDKTSIGDRMKNNYENRSKTYLMRRNPIIIRLDGCHFHSFTKGFNKPFDELFILTMQETSKYLCENIQGCKLAYTSSDEISFLLIDYEKLNTDAWFDYAVQKIASVSASMATLAFNKFFDYNAMASENAKYIRKINTAIFDSRCFSIPKEEVVNYFIWRQQDCKRNSVSMLGYSEFSNKQLYKKNNKQVQEMLLEKGIDWNDLEIHKKLGRCVKKQEIDGKSKWVIDKKIPVFTDDRCYIEKLI